MEANRFKLIGTISREPHIGGTYCFIGVKAPAGQYESYFDVSVFGDELMATAARLKEGDPVTVTGHMSMRKNKQTNRYDLKLIAEVIKTEESAAVNAVREVFPNATQVSKAPF